MKAFRILLALAFAGATFYSLNVLAVQNGYRDRLDFKNRHYHGEDCDREQRRNHSFSHHNRNMVNPVVTKPDTSERIINVK
jgi:hypothetical protein